MDEPRNTTISQLFVSVRQLIIHNLHHMIQEPFGLDLTIPFPNVSMTFQYLPLLVDPGPILPFGQPGSLPRLAIL